MKVISVCQLWARLTVYGYKDVGNRPWATGYRGSVLTHASKALDPRFDDIRADILAKRGDIPDRRVIERGGIVEQATIVDCIDAPRHERDDWFWRPYSFVVGSGTPRGYTGSHEPGRWPRTRTNHSDAKRGRNPLHKHSEGCNSPLVGRTKDEHAVELGEGYV